MNGLIFPVPPIVEQRTALNPDGTPDPAGTTDCGEACVASALAGIRSFRISPGCIRQALGLPEFDGRSTGGEIRRVLEGVGLGASVGSVTGDSLWRALGRLRHHGRYTMLLGDWIAPGALHWVLAYEREAESLSFMDPWTGRLLTQGRDVLASKGVIQQVFMW